MTSVAALVKLLTADGRLVAYFKALALYVVTWTYCPLPAARVAAKALPVLLLAAALRRHTKHCIKGSEQQRVCEYLYMGLGASACGDALLECGLFEPGMAAFAVAQGCYWRAWGPQGLRGVRAGLVVVAAGYGAWLRAPGLLRALVPLYAAALAAAVGRGVARGAARGGVHAAAGALGSAAFGASDALLGYAMFRAPLPHRTLAVMSTYYAAQYGIALAAFQPV